MEYSELYERLELLLEKSRVGILTTVDSADFPHSRWLTPVLIPGRSGYLYALTAPDSEKAAQLAAHPKVEWTFQSRTLDEILTVRGIAELVDEPQAKAEVMEAIGPRLQIFWRVNPDAKNLVVVETEVVDIDVFFPMKNERHRAVRG